jgi:hypothetical protein
MTEAFIAGAEEEPPQEVSEPCIRKITPNVAAG